MGYTTKFSGQFKLNKPLAPPHRAYLKAFNETRRMKRDARIAETLPDPMRLAAGLPIGTDGEYFVGAGGLMGQDTDASVVDYNAAPMLQPGLWCKWAPSESGDAIEWDCGEKFYDYVEWLEYIIDRFLTPWGYKLNGDVEWEGEESGDNGTISVIDSKVTVREHYLGVDGDLVRIEVEIPAKLIEQYRHDDDGAERIADLVVAAAAKQ